MPLHCVGTTEQKIIYKSTTPGGMNNDSSIDFQSITTTDNQLRTSSGPAHSNRNAGRTGGCVWVYCHGHF